MNNHLRVAELQRRAEQVKTKEEARAILTEATLLQELDKKLRS